ncbi:MAG: STAS domain-containing protein [Thermoguttaceae bacterium]|jgi:anti-anti-sigma factor|nr:STAS domain-containing protein [Thermoguttaceae bacterium]
MITLARQNEVTVIELGPAYDSLDDAALDELGSLLLTKAATAEPPYLVLDLSKTDFVGSLFIELLVRAWKRLSERGGAFALCCVHPFCEEVLKITHLNTLWESFPNRGSAVESLSKWLAETGK